MSKALVVTAAGINCDRELVEAFELAGATASSIHINQLISDPANVDQFDLIGIPGGFSYGDAVAAGRIAAAMMRPLLYPAFVRAVQRGVPIIAPCNGFQIAVQMGLLPGPEEDEPWPRAAPRPTVALAQNESGRFIDRWYSVEIPRNTRCIWTQGLDSSEGDDPRMMLPVAHGEGRFIPESDELLARLERNGQIAVRYTAEGGTPSGSIGRIAGICDASGLILGLMPHPERFTRWTQHPWWTRFNEREMKSAPVPLGLQMFKNAVEYLRNRKHESRRSAVGYSLSSIGDSAAEPQPKAASS